MRATLLGLAAIVCLAQPADIIYSNGKIITMSKDRPIAEAVAIRGNRFVAVGSNAEVAKAAGPATVRVDLKGRTVVPGLVENHTHPITAALAEQDQPVPTMNSIADIQAY